MYKEGWKSMKDYKSAIDLQTKEIERLLKKQKKMKIKEMASKLLYEVFDVLFFFRKPLIWVYLGIIAVIMISSYFTYGTIFKISHKDVILVAKCSGFLIASHLLPYGSQKLYWQQQTNSMRITRSIENARNYLFSLIDESNEYHERKVNSNKDSSKQTKENYRGKQKEPVKENKNMIEDEVLVASLFIGMDTKEKVMARYKGLLKTYHPDEKTGSSEMCAMITNEKNRLLKTL